ncbi:MAG: hypothetical protein JXP48_00855 [Acidobacteria bacterium]|nr:hypothetical protein [Acidobacteriota bacterium]
MESFLSLWIFGFLFTLAAFPISGRFMARLALGLLMLPFWPVMLGIMARNLYLKIIND